MEDFAEAHQDALKGVLDLSHGIASSRKIKYLLQKFLDQKGRTAKRRVVGC
jgi:hypothetical protein